MSLEKIVAEAMAGRPLEMKEAFEEVIQAKVVAALEEKYAAMTESEELDEEDLLESDDEDEDDMEDEDEEDEDEEDEDEE